jgi:hypothetical protein
MSAKLILPTDEWFSTTKRSQKLVLTIAVGRFTYVLMNGMTSAPLPGAVTMRTSLVSLKIV